MLSNNPHAVSIWFLIGLQLDIYGVLITGAGIWDYLYPAAVHLKMAEYHAGIWWGIIMLVLGLYYTICYAPVAKNKHVL